MQIHRTRRREADRCNLIMERRQVVTVGVVGGSDLVKISEQLGKDSEPCCPPARQPRQNSVSSRSRSSQQRCRCAGGVSPDVVRLRIL